MSSGFVGADSSLRLGIVPGSNETEDKFEDAMEVTANSPFFKIAVMFVRFAHVAGFIVNADHSIMLSDFLH